LEGEIKNEKHNLGTFRGRVSRHDNRFHIEKRPSSGAFPALRAGNRAFRFNSSVLLSQALRDFRYNPLRAQGLSKY
jgi:hypothetical protein